MSTADQLTAALDELDAIRTQLRQALSGHRTARFYDLLRRIPGGMMTAATVIELSGGWVVVHWAHGPVVLYRTILDARNALCTDGEHILSFEDASVRRDRPGRGQEPPLNDKERTILALVGRGLPNRAIADQLGFSEHHVKNCLSAVYRKLNVTDRTQAALLVRDLTG